MLTKAKLGDDITSLEGLAPISVIVGRNGAGKSRFMRRLAHQLMNLHQEFNVRYVSPERGGAFKRESGIEDAIQGDGTWLHNSRDRNQVHNFKASSAVLLRELETGWLRELQFYTSSEPRLFTEQVLQKFNNLLSNVQIVAEGTVFVFRTMAGEKIEADQISSGESEAVSLAAEILHFFNQLVPLRFNVLLVDEPDVHLHPDLQAALARLIVHEIKSLKPELVDRTVVCIATHSTPLVCELSNYEKTKVGNKEFHSEHVHLKKMPKAVSEIAPFFGHPLSRCITDDVLLIVEGEDDAQVWQQAARSSEGRVKVFPCVATSVDQQTELENFSADVLYSIYDDPIAFSIRDGDGVREPLEDIEPVRRLRLQCYELENLLLTDDCLKIMECSWEAFRARADAWCKANDKHKDVAMVRELADSKDRLRDKKIKDIRNLIPGIAGSTKPWTAVVAKAIAEATKEPKKAPVNSLVEFFGERFSELVEDTHAKADVVQTDQG